MLNSALKTTTTWYRHAHVFVADNISRLFRYVRNNPKNVVAAIIVLALVWTWGFATQRYKIFPHSPLRDLYFTALDHIDMQARKDQSLRTERSILSPFLEEHKQYAFTLYNRLLEDTETMRNTLKEKLILPKDGVSISKLSEQDANRFLSEHAPLTKGDVFQATYYGIHTYGVLQTNGTNDCLLVYHQGHFGNPFDAEYHTIIAENFMEKGCDVLSLAMIGLGFNTGTSSYPARFNPHTKERTLTLSAKRASHHSNYQWFYDPAYPQVHGLALFLTGNYYIIEHLLPNYAKTSMVGISGGGWQTTLTSALIPEIDRSYSFAGSFPLFFRTEEKNIGDWEQTEAKIWDEYGYIDFYILSLFDEQGLPTREHHLIYHDNDECCFTGPDAVIFSRHVENLAIPGLHAYLLEQREHAIDTNFFYSLYFSDGSLEK